jgi:hypothetical protein
MQPLMGVLARTRMHGTWLTFVTLPVTGHPASLEQLTRLPVKGRITSFLTHYIKGRSGRLRAPARASARRELFRCNTSRVTKIGGNRAGIAGTVGRCVAWAMKEADVSGRHSGCHGLAISSRSYLWRS